MASGDTLFTLYPLGSVPSASSAATLDFIADASTPAMHIPVLDFDGAADEHADWYVIIPSHYSAGTGFTFAYQYAVSGTDEDIVDLEFRVQEFTDLDILTNDLGIDQQTPVSIQDTPASTPTNKLNVSTTGALAKASFGSAVAGQLIIIRCTRDIAAADNANDVQLLSVLVTDT